MSSIISDPTAAQLAKLPVWAQRHIEYLQRERADAARHIARISEGPEDSDTFIRDHVHPDRMLGKGTEVSFMLPATAGHDAGRVTASVNEYGYLEVMSSDGSLHVIPRSSNVVKVKIGDY